ncbi:hypothetical protein [Altericista sp. CCNU0014]|uniref:hypothetical protein n=1 Tax=Altericista sp. CCNU0014 TaxID=3082949 RepID=UPI00384C2132
MKKQSYALLASGFISTLLIGALSCPANGASKTYYGNAGDLTMRCSLFTGGKAVASFTVNTSKSFTVITSLTGDVFFDNFFDDNSIVFGGNGKAIYNSPSYYSTARRTYFWAYLFGIGNDGAGNTVYFYPAEGNGYVNCG